MVSTPEKLFLMCNSCHPHYELVPYVCMCIYVRVFMCVYLKICLHVLPFLYSGLYGLKFS